MLVTMRLVIVVLMTSLTAPAYADQFCFSLAESYYQQLYCEVKASGKGAGLPSFYDFRRNDEMMQALLIKQFASRIGIKVALPKSSGGGKSTATARADNNILVGSEQALQDRCQRQANIIHCGGNSYQLVGNRKNTFLSSGALTTSNKMALPEYQGSMSDTQNIEQYLSQTYYHYLQKMMTIGLGGSTLSYGKFAFLFNDLNSKGVNFSQRFETMYGYLKKDKKIMAVPTKSEAPAQLALSDCYPLQQLLVCSVAMNNWLFDRK